MNSASVNLSRIMQSENLERSCFHFSKHADLCFVGFSVNFFVLTHTCGNGHHNLFNALTLERTLHYPSFLVTRLPFPNNLPETAVSPQLHALTHIHDSLLQPVITGKLLESGKHIMIWKRLVLSQRACTRQAPRLRDMCALIPVKTLRRHLTHEHLLLREVQ